MDDLKFPISFNPMPVGKVLKHLETLMERRVLSDEWTDLIDRACELLKEKTSDAVKKASEGVMPMAYWEETESDGHCSNCGKDRPWFIVDWQHEPISTKYCPHCGAKMENTDGEDGDRNG